MKAFLAVAIFVLINVIVISAKPQFSQCGPNGCSNINHNGQGVGCGPGGCGFIGQPQGTYNTAPAYHPQPQPRKF